MNIGSLVIIHTKEYGEHTGLLVSIDHIKKVAKVDISNGDGFILTVPVQYCHEIKSKYDKR